MTRSIFFSGSLSTLLLSLAIPLVHFLTQVSWCPFVSHYPFMHVRDCNLHIFESFDKVFTLWLQGKHANNFLMHGKRLLIEILHGLSKFRYFIKYHYFHFLQVDLCESCILICCAMLFNLLPRKH